MATTRRSRVRKALKDVLELFAADDGAFRGVTIDDKEMLRQLTDAAISAVNT